MLRLGAASLPVNVKRPEEPVNGTDVLTAAIPRFTVQGIVLASSGSFSLVLLTKRSGRDFRVGPGRFRDQFVGVVRRGRLEGRTGQMQRGRCGRRSRRSG